MYTYPYWDWVLYGKAGINIHFHSILTQIKNSHNILTPMR